VPFDKWDRPLFKDEVARRSATRVTAEPEFRYIVEDTELVHKRLAENKLTLNLEKRKAELEEEKAKKTRRNAERAKLKPTEDKRFVITLDNVNKPELEPFVDKSKEEAKPKDAKAEDDDDDDADEETGGQTPVVDPIRGESLNILADLIDLSRGPKTAQATPAVK
jgi:hypothetical protein